MSEKFKMGVVGTGRMGQYHVNVLKMLSTHEISGIYDSDAEKAAEVANRFGVKAYSELDDLLNDSNAVTIAVPTNLHFDVAWKAIEKDCHVLLEKPMTQTVEQAKKLVAFAAEKQRVLQVGHVERFNGAVMELQKIVENPLHIETRRLAPYTPRISDVGVILDMLIHDLDIVTNLVKSPIKHYSAMGRSVKTEFEDIAVVSIVFENDTLATLSASRVSQTKERMMTISQEDSFIKLNYTNQDIEIHRQASSANTASPEAIRYSQESIVENLYVHKDNPLKSEQIHFYNCITDREKPIVPNEKDIETLIIALSSIEMIADGRLC